eukprot:scaffold13970_cov101-Isochrysis_galbana.AAC.1
MRQAVYLRLRETRAQMGQQTNHGEGRVQHRRGCAAAGAGRGERARGAFPGGAGGRELAASFTSMYVYATRALAAGGARVA